MGLAAAQNVGIRRAFELSCDFVLLPDRTASCSADGRTRCSMRTKNWYNRGLSHCRCGPPTGRRTDQDLAAVVQARGLRMQSVTSITHEGARNGVPGRLRLSDLGVEHWSRSD